MKPFDPRWMAQTVNGAWSCLPKRSLKRFIHDSREVQSGDVYVALIGDRLDGHDFVDQAFARGASAALVQACHAAGSKDQALLQVPDTLLALQQLAGAHRARFRGKIIGITGSVGKTTVKEMVSSVLAKAGQVVKTKGNWNNHIGLPMSMLQLDDATDFGVFEAGINHPGEMSVLAEIMKPDWVIMTPVGVSHIEFFDSVEHIVREKRMLAQALPADGCIVLDQCSDWYALLKDGVTCSVVSVGFGLDSTVDVQGIENVDSNGFTICSAGCYLSQSAVADVRQKHLRHDALLAAAIGLQAGLSLQDIADALGSVKPQAMRGTSLQIGETRFINDAYNANPLSMKASIEAFALQVNPAHAVLVLGSMRELGREADKEHREVGKMAGVYPWQAVLAVGSQAARILEGLCTTSYSGAQMNPVNTAEAALQLSQLNDVHPIEAVLVKASRGDRLEQVIKDYQMMKQGKAT